MELNDAHQKAQILGVRFSRNGKHIASCDNQGRLVLWHLDSVRHAIESKQDESMTSPSSSSSSSNFSSSFSEAIRFIRHRGAVTECHWIKDDTQILTSSGDETCAILDIEQGKTLRRFHSSTSACVVNSCAPSSLDENCFASACDDGSVRYFDSRQAKKEAIVQRFDCATDDAVLCVVSADVGSQRMYASTLMGDIHALDTRKLNEPLFSMQGGGSTGAGVTGIDVRSGDAAFLVANAMDAHVRVFDVRSSSSSSSPSERCVRSWPNIVEHSFEQLLLRARFSPTLIAVASASDCNAHLLRGGASLIVDQLTAAESDTLTPLLSSLSGHRGAVTDVDFHPSEALIVSASLDSSLIIADFASFVCESEL